MISQTYMPPFLEALRPHQWVKNLLVLAPLFFTDQAFDPAGWLAALTALGSFCFAASAVYLLNDILDRHDDAPGGVRHPPVRARRRGRISVP